MREDAEHLEFVHQYLKDYVIVADRKAAVMLSISVALLLFLFEGGCTERAVIFWLAVGGLLAVLFFGWSTLMPRTGGGKGGEFIYWRGIGSFSSVGEYARAWNELGASNWKGQLLRQNYVMSVVLSRKYRSITAGMSALGWTVTLLIVGYIHEYLDLGW